MKSGLFNIVKTARRAFYDPIQFVCKGVFQQSNDQRRTTSNLNDPKVVERSVRSRCARLLHYTVKSCSRILVWTGPCNLLSGVSSTRFALGGVLSLVQEVSSSSCRAHHLYHKDSLLIPKVTTATPMVCTTRTRMETHSPVISQVLEAYRQDLCFRNSLRSSLSLCSG